MPEDQQERRIAQGLREGKTEAWQTLHDIYAEQVWRGVARLLGPSAADVADVVQETMIAAARSAGNFDIERGSLWPWLWGIAHNHAVLHLRKQEQRNRLAKAVASRERPSASVPSASGLLADAELASRVRAILAELPVDYGALLTAKYLDGATVAELAARDRSTEVAVRSKLARARAAFREAFGTYDDEIVRSKESDHESS
jgi:RNA polymerase sigma-70 factor (ECF subfamily)